MFLNSSRLCTALVEQRCTSMSGKLTRHQLPLLHPSHNLGINLKTKIVENFWPFSDTTCGPNTSIVRGWRARCRRDRRGDVSTRRHWSPSICWMAPANWSRFCGIDERQAWMQWPWTSPLEFQSRPPYLSKGLYMLALRHWNLRLWGRISPVTLLPASESRTPNGSRHGGWLQWLYHTQLSAWQKYNKLSLTLWATCEVIYLKNVHPFWWRNCYLPCIYDSL